MKPKPAPPANPMYERQPLRVHAKTFSCDPLLREELQALYRAIGVKVLPDQWDENPEQGQPRSRK